MSDRRGRVALTLPDRSGTSSALTISFLHNWRGVESTGLVWQKGQSANRRAFESAAAYCSSLALGNETWRVPSPQELSTLLDEARDFGTINLDVFPSTVYDPGDDFSPYWVLGPADSSTPEEASGMEFVNGFLHDYDVTTQDGWVKCVR